MRIPESEVEIGLGTIICRTIKDIYFKGIPWDKCWKEVSTLFNDLKKAAEPFNKGDKLEFLLMIKKFTHEDIKDLLDQNPLTHKFDTDLSTETVDNLR